MPQKHKVNEQRLTKNPKSNATDNKKSTPRKPSSRNSSQPRSPAEIKISGSTSGNGFAPTR